MEFTYHAYRNMISTLRECNYEFGNYQTYNLKEMNPNDGRYCILRHDIDFSVEKAYCLSRLEEELGVTSTYFVLVSSNFYNPASEKNRKMLKKIKECGCDIGLHFDEAAYMDYPMEIRKEFAQKERRRLEDILEMEIRSVSMHRPSKETLEANWKFDGMVNSYSALFFRDFKYLSDSHRKWREPVLDVIMAKEYNRLHILTHPFWYEERETDLHCSIAAFVNHANYERYENLKENFTDLENVMKEGEIKGIC